MMESSISPAANTAWVDHIPVLWLEPARPALIHRLGIFLPYLSGTKEHMLPYLEALTAAGFVALSFDPWQHGARGQETPDQVSARVFGNFRRHMWPILGQTALDTLRIVDWAVATLHVAPEIAIGGISMGGDIAVAAGGLDHRIKRVAAVVATPDWLRPGMRDVGNPDRVLPPGEPDAYAQFFYDNFNPLTHLDRYAGTPEVRFICGENDTHVPPDGAFRFQGVLREQYPAAAERVEIEMIEGMEHMGAGQSELWWPECLAWLARDYPNKTPK